MRFVVGDAASIPPGSVTIVEPWPDAPGIGVFNIGGEFFALRNECPHMGAPLCRGRLTGTTQPQVRRDRPPTMDWVREGEIIMCPWHHWEFEVRTGRTIFRSRTRARRYTVTLEPAVAQGRLEQGVTTYPVSVEEAVVILELGDR